VQENLFPARETDLGSLRLVASSQPFSRIGGDYYDFFSATDKALGVFIGDVSGHGISAALIMAMAKATMIHERLNFAGIDKLINAIDQTIFLNRKSGTREYMTGLFLTIDSDTGDCQLLNRGHCMPILIKRDGCSSEHVQSGGLPLGYNAPERNQMVTFRLNPGETLCLYTDGMAEVHGGNGTALGYEGLKQMLLECWSDQIDTYLQLLLQSHKNWAKKQDDDQTVILIKRNK
jgi:sigma-B regulation protein RsbU (phosphoserine phosphatase)